MSLENLYIERVKSGDTDAFKHLVQQYSDMAYAIAFRIVKNQADAEEIVQDSFVKVYKNIQSFRNDSKFSTWLYKIIYNTSITKHNKNLKTKAVEFNPAVENDYDSATLVSSLSSLKKDEQKKFINLALNKLSSEDSLLLSLFYLTENTVEEIEVITGFSKSNIKTRMHRARKKMYTQLQGILKNECPRNLL